MRSLIVSCLGLMALGSQFASASHQSLCLFGEQREVLVSEKYHDLEILRRNYFSDGISLNDLERKVTGKTDSDFDEDGEGGLITFKAKQNGRTYLAYDHIDNGYMDIYDVETMEMVAQTDHGQMEYCDVSFDDVESLPFYYGMPADNDDYYGFFLLGGNLVELARLERIEVSEVLKEVQKGYLEKYNRYYHNYTLKDRKSGETFKMRLQVSKDGSKVQNGSIELVTENFNVQVALVNETGNLYHFNLEER